MTTKQVINELQIVGTCRVNGYQLDYGFCEIHIYRLSDMEHVATYEKWEFLEWLDENL